MSALPRPAQVTLPPSASVTETVLTSGSSVRHTPPECRAHLYS